MFARKLPSVHTHTHTCTQLLPMADKILDFYAEQDPKQLTHLLLYSWLREYSTGRHITHTGATHTHTHTHTQATHTQGTHTQGPHTHRPHTHRPHTQGPHTHRGHTHRGHTHTGTTAHTY